MILSDTLQCLEYEVLTIIQYYDEGRMPSSTLNYYNGITSPVGDVRIINVVVIDGTRAFRVSPNDAEDNETKKDRSQESESY